MNNSNYVDLTTDPPPNPPADKKSAKQMRIQQRRLFEEQSQSQQQQQRQGLQQQPAKISRSEQVIDLTDSPLRQSPIHFSETLVQRFPPPQSTAIPAGKARCQ